MFVQHPLLRPDTIEDRPYQGRLATLAQAAPSLIVLPTGLGKTVIGLRAMLPHLAAHPDRRVLVLAPTKPLCEQHAAFFRQVLADVPVALLTGEQPPTERDGTWTRNRVIVATPQVIQNDLVRGARDLSDVSYILYDEAHRATGNYSYIFIARRYKAAGGRAALGLTASPGNDPLALQRVLRNLSLDRVEVLRESDPEVVPYVHEVATEWIRVRPSHENVQMVRLLERMYGRCVLALRRYGYLTTLRGLPTRKDLLMLGQRLRADASDRNARRSVYDAVSVQARALKLQHALELAETQGTPSLRSFLDRLVEEATSTAGSKASRDLVREPEFDACLALARADQSTPPKQLRLVALVRETLALGARRVLIFANYRETADQIVARLTNVPDVRAERFVGHARAAGEAGLTKKQQGAVVDRFRSGDINVLVATAVGEEGLDLPQTDAVILHEPVPSAIRFVQRRGRTGRRSDGRLFVLLTEGTRDMTYHYSALRRERKMNENLAAVRRLRPLPGATPEPPPVAKPTPVPTPRPVDVEIVIDPRESTCAVARHLVERGVRLRTRVLDTGDYAISDRLLVERKSAQDFAASLKDGRLFEQLPRLAQSERAILLVEGDPFHAATGISPQALAGALAAASSDHKVSVVTVPDAEAAADYLTSLARRERHEGHGPPTTRMAKSPADPQAQIRFVLEGLPHVGPVVANHLLARFGTIAAIAAADPADLAQTPGVGPETARAVHDVLHRQYPASPLVAASRGTHAAVMPLQGSNGSTG